MKRRICLHGLEVRHQSVLLAAVRHVLPSCSVKYKIKEKFMTGGDMYKYRRACFRPQGKPLFRVICRYGVLISADRPQPLAEIVLEYDSSAKAASEAVRRIVRRLLAGKIKFILEEPNLARRAAQLRGRYSITDLPEYDADNACSAVQCHLPWQVYAVSRLWSQLLERSGDKTLVRQLRVKIRRLRSVLKLLKPLLAEGEAEQWQKKLKSMADRLSAAREYDVALMVCAKIRQHHAGGELQMQNLQSLESLLMKQRQKAASGLTRGAEVNDWTGRLTDLLLVLYGQKQHGRYSGTGISEFMQMRFLHWYDKIVNMPEEIGTIRDMEKLHRIRIRIKRFRYALQAVPEITGNSVLRRSAKFMQDKLGLLHDDYVNDIMVKELLAANQDDKELCCDGALFCGWAQARADSALETLPEDWEKFCAVLKQWREEAL